MGSGDNMCVLLSCAGGDHWALPQNCLAEILTLSAVDEHPPTEASWRGCMIPVMVAGGDKVSAAGWRDEHSGSGLVAVIPGLHGMACDYWAVAIIGDGLRLCPMQEVDIEDLPGEAREYASAAFRLDGITYQVPDLKGLQAEICAGLAA